MNFTHIFGPSSVADLADVFAGEAAGTGDRAGAYTAGKGSSDCGEEFCAGAVVCRSGGAYDRIVIRHATQYRTTMFANKVDIFADKV